MDAVDQIISDANLKDAPLPVDKTPEKQETPVTEPKVEEAPKEADDDQSEHDDQEFSERAKKILAKKNAAIGKKTAKLYEARAIIAEREAELQKIREEYARVTQPKQQQQVSDPNSPREEDFPNDYGAYLKASALYELRKEIAEREATQNKTKEHGDQIVHLQQWEAERKNALDVAGDSYLVENPEIAELVQQNAETIRAFSPEINKAIFDSDPMDVVKAFHHMARSGTLDDVSDMSYADARVAIVKAANARTVSKAPAPLKSARGSSSSSNDLSSKSPDELMQWLKS